MSAVAGHLAPRFEAVRDAIEHQLRLGSEVGLSLAVDHAGERVIDAWAGHTDAARTTPWQQDTITNVFSTTKTVTSLAVLLLVDAGEIDVHSPVCRYWPEFGAEGKDRIEVRHLLSHTAGLPAVEQPVRLEDLYDTRGTAARLAAQQPWWEPGTASGYHLLTYGHLLGELVHRVAGDGLREFVATELAWSLQADFQIGVRPGDLHRVSDAILPPAEFDPSVLDHRSVAYRAFTGPVIPAAAANSSGWRSANLGGGNGHGNASALVELFAPLTTGSLLKSSTVDLIFDEQSNGPDLVHGRHTRWGIGFALSDPRTLPWIPAGRVAFWGGWGGSMLIADLDRQLTIAYVMNNMGTDLLGGERAAAYVNAIYAAVTART